jgi:hypothetical protein
MADITNMYRELFRNPKDTLRRNLMVVVAGRHGAGRYTSWEGDVKGFTTGLSGKLGIIKDRARYDFSHAGDATGTFNLANGELHAYYFPMNQDVVGMTPDPNTNYLDIPRVALLKTPKIVWTGQLSACHIGIWKQAPNSTIRLCHIQPMTAEQARHAMIPDTSPERHKHIDKRTLPRYAPQHEECSILVHPKMGPVERATTDKVYFIGLYIEKWRFFFTHAVEGKLSEVVELRDGVHEY